MLSKSASSTMTFGCRHFARLRGSCGYATSASSSGTWFPENAKHADSNSILFNLEQQDLVVIGGGPGGYVAAIKAAQLGLKVDTGDSCL